MLGEAGWDAVIRPAVVVVNLVGVLVEGRGQRFDALQAQLPARLPIPPPGLAIDLAGKPIPV